MKKDPTFDMTQFPCYLTIRQKELLKEASREMKVTISELLREAMHYWLKERAGKDDGLMCDSEEFLEGWKRGLKEMAVEAVLRRRQERERQKGEKETRSANENIEAPAKIEASK